MNIKTLSYWHKLEHFYPYVLEEQHSQKIKTFNINEECDFPNFMDPLIPADCCVRYYEVYLGIFKVNSALTVIAQQMDAEKEFRDESDETSCFCKFRLSADGKFDETSFRISSFPWAVHRVEQGQIWVDQWDEDFHDYEKRLFMQLFNINEPFDYQKCREILDRISKDISWNIAFSECWMRVDRVIGEKTWEQTEQQKEEIEEENRQIDELIKANDLLNSFYVRDLEKIIQNVNEGNYGQALDIYLEHDADNRIDVEHDKNVLFDLFDPKKMPYGKWPSGYSLRSMQQLAVNIAMNHTEEYLSVFSVNGPPGTGKTTLLRDVIAANIVERAITLCKYNVPDDAFVREIGTVSYNGFSNVVKEIDEDLKKYSMLVVSNNNAAVKNITMELPDIESIHKEYHEQYTYFNEISDQILGKKSWGLCAAALGNKKNCSDFIEVFWPLKKEEDDLFDFNRYLRKIHSGEEKRTPEQCKKNWNQAKEKFQHAFEEVQIEYQEMDKCYKRLVELRDMYAEHVKARRKYDDLLMDIDASHAEKKEVETYIQDLEMQLKKMKIRREDIKGQVSFFKLKYFVNSKNAMIQAYKDFERKESESLGEKFRQQDKVEKLEEEIKKKEIEREEHAEKLNDQERQIKEQEQQIADLQLKYEVNIPDEKFLVELTGDGTEDEYKKAQERAPWNGTRINRLRENLFLEAMNLQQAFVENSPQMRNQLDAFSKMMRGKLSTAQMNQYATALFQGFMLAVPVVSSTFASVGSFLKYVGKEEIGLLLADESGQAMPQSAVGAIWRSKRVIAVGDPLQIEPVVTIHDKTIEFLKQYYDQSAFIASKITSVQSLADAANSYVGIRELNEEEFYVGAPLLVHGRCQRKIFDIANSIAYNNTMIYNTKNREKSVCAWINVKGSSQNRHFVPEQAERILPIVKEAFWNSWEEKGIDEVPSLFIISPFRNVRAGLVRYFRKNDLLYHELCKDENYDCKRSISNWISKNIGTIHTFQGKEADMVIICLGVDSGDKESGAVEWACSKPNILNVAVTRAKNNLYIVGDADKWAKKPYFSTAYEVCDKV